MAVCLATDAIENLCENSKGGGGEEVTLIKLSIINTNTSNFSMKLIYIMLYTFINACMFLFYLKTILC